MKGAEVVHTVLKVAHVPEEIFGHFGRGFDAAGRGQRRTVQRIGVLTSGWGRWWVSD